MTSIPIEAIVKEEYSGKVQVKPRGAKVGNKNYITWKMQSFFFNYLHPKYHNPYQ